MAKPGTTGWRRIRNAAIYSKQGLSAAWRHEAAFRQELILCIALAPLAFVVAANLIQAAILLCTLGLVLITELLNSAIEAVVDRVSEDHNDLAGRAKDMGSAAVFISLVLVVVVWVLVGLHNYVPG